MKIDGSDLERKKRKNYFSKLIICLLNNKSQIVNPRSLNLRDSLLPREIEQRS